MANGAQRTDLTFYDWRDVVFSTRMSGSVRERRRNAQGVWLLYYRAICFAPANVCDRAITVMARFTRGSSKLYERMPVLSSPVTRFSGGRGKGSPPKKSKTVPQTHFAPCHIMQKSFNRKDRKWILSETLTFRFATFYETFYYETLTLNL